MKRIAYIEVSLSDVKVKQSRILTVSESPGMKVDFKHNKM
jgi:hypothetical protein